MKKSGEFLLPGFAKFIVVKAGHQGAHGHQPVHQEPTVFKASRPARCSRSVL
jgi:hypothetical protein